MTSEEDGEDELGGRTYASTLNAPVSDEDELFSSPSSAAGSRLLSAFTKNRPSLAAQRCIPKYDYVVQSVPQISLEVRVKSASRSRDYPVFNHDPQIESILEEFEEDGTLRYWVAKEGGSEQDVSFDELTKLPGGRQALNEFWAQDGTASQPTNLFDSDSIMVTTRKSRGSARQANFVDITAYNLSEEEEDEIAQPTGKSATRTRQLRSSAMMAPDNPESEDDAFENESNARSKRRKKTPQTHKSRPKRSTQNANPTYNDGLPPTPGSNGKPSGRRRPSVPFAGSLRRSEREKKTTSMREIAEDDIPESRARSEKSLVPKVTGAKESFQKLPISDGFRCRHLQICDTCNEPNDVAGRGFLVYCQGCSLAYHIPCLGSRNGREHLVTKINEGDFVLQCRRCVEAARKKDHLAPRHGRCTDCGNRGPACKPFRPHKTARDEHKEREQNDGQDPITKVPASSINNVANIFFRCVGCYQAFHFLHLPPKVEEHSIIEKHDDEAKAEKRFAEYCQTWLCHDCETAPDDIGALVAWRPKNVNAYEVGTTVEEVPEDEKEYLIKWQNKSYYRSTWKNGSWVWGKTNVSTRKAFARKDDHANLPKMRTEDAIPEDYLRVDIVFDVQYNNKVSVEIEEVDRARIREVKLAMVKYKGLAYEDVVWEEPPPVEDTERYADFKLAYEDWVRGKYMHVITVNTLATNVRKTRGLNFEEKILQKEQPKSLKGGQLMQHQQDGLNWLLYKWYCGQNGILADEMGLGKTIQIIAFMAALQEKFNLAPFLIVVPNATCANWRREIKQWAPALRVATFFGSAAARDLAQKYELFPKRDKVLRCHVVVTSYDAAQDENCQRVFNRISWTALVVDEGQRLKNDKNLLYQALSGLKVTFTVLLTGTPIQNNPRELFNLLAFLDKSLDAHMLEEENRDLTQEKVEKVHGMLKSFILRRTKRETLKDLPAMAQIIVPITMSPLQKKLYKSILGKNADLLKAIFGGDHRGPIKGLRNVLMQLRQCLCHPYVYNQDIEGKTEEASSHRQLVEASAKLQILDIMLPKLKERGHRVLIFSQFLHMLTIVEDFLSGLALEHLRLDGTMGSLEKQKCIDAFNAPNSNVFALLLSTRAGGVGINLATADTVIIMDPDFNPHQDIQAISRAHRLGQEKKVLVFQLMTRMSAEERILDIGKRKMALDHVLIEQMDRDEEDGQDLESVLRFGAESLFKDDVTHDIRYDPVSVDKLLDRSQVEDIAQGQNDSAESSFSFARIWQNESSAMVNSLGTEPDNLTVNDDVWQKIMEERQRQADEAKNKAEQLGRGKRNRKNVDYGNQTVHGHEVGLDKVDDFGEPEIDPDFQARPSSDEDEDEENEGGQARAKGSEERVHANKVSIPKPQSSNSNAFKRAKVRQPLTTSTQQPSNRRCLACNNRYGSHDPGLCPAKLAGFEHCNLCGQAHFGTPGSCLQMRSEERIRAHLQTLKNSPEQKDLVERARGHLKADLANVVTEKRRKHAAAIARSGTNDTHRPSDGSTRQRSDQNKKSATVPAPSNHGNPPMTSAKAYSGQALPQFAGPSPYPGQHGLNQHPTDYGVTTQHERAAIQDSSLLTQSVPANARSSLPLAN